MNNKRIILLAILALNLQHFPLGKSENFPSAPAIYVFGDSLFDSGNNNFLPTLAKGNYEPYGMNFVKGPTGRFTDGRTTADFIAEYLGLPYAPPYMGSQGFNQLTGLNFASAACGILPETGNHLGKCLNFKEQVDFFQKIVEQELPKYYQNPNDLSNYLSKSVFLVSIGNNDYIMNYLDTLLHNTGKQYSPQSFAKLLIDNLAQQFQRLYQLGARKVIMLELGPIGCIPSNTRRIKHDGQCVEDINQLAVVFNNQLASLLQHLRSSLQGSNFILGQSYQLAYDAIINPSKYGLIDSSNPCCVAWFNGTLPCILATGTLACKQPQKNYFWDGYHPTEAVYRVVASNCFNGSSFCIPKNIKELILQDGR